MPDLLSYPEQRLPAVQVVSLFSATMPERVEELARSMLKAPVKVTVGGRSAPTSSVQQRLVYVGQESGKLMALRDALQSGLRPPVLVFTNSRQRAFALHRRVCPVASARPPW